MPDGIVGEACRGKVVGLGLEQGDMVRQHSEVVELMGNVGKISLELLVGAPCDILGVELELEMKCRRFVQLPTKA